MNIYTTDNKEIRDIMISFIKTKYGKVTFVISYSLFFLFLIITLITSCFYKFTNPLIFVFFVLCLISFIWGSANYYKELRIFAKEKNK